MKIGILTAGSDSPGLNAAIRSIGKAAQGSYGMQVIGFQDGFEGLIADQTVDISGQALSGILTAGGTILGTSRTILCDIQQNEQGSDLVTKAIATYQKHNLDALVCIGGLETQANAFFLAQKGLNLITLPKAIGNDVTCTDQTIGFDTAVEVGAGSIDRLHSTAHSHHRIIIVELMGRETGWLALGAGIAGGADVILIPEIPYDIQKVAEAILTRSRSGKRFSLVAVAESLISQEQVSFINRLKRINARLRSESEMEKVEHRLAEIESRRTDTTLHVSNLLKDLTGLETRITILGYLLRGGAPSATDRLLATQLGTACVSMINDRQFGIMVAIRGGEVEGVPLDQVAAKHKYVPSDHPWIESARRVGTNLGD